jgi:hypothetical protein
MKNVRFAFAIDGNKQYTDKNFSQAEFYRFYEYQLDTTELLFIAEIQNPSFTIDEEQKVSGLIDFLKENRIDLLVAKNYSQKLKAECEFFVPIIVERQLPIDQVCALVKKHIRWLIDELSLNKKENMVFNITTGIYKYKIENEK